MPEHGAIVLDLNKLRGGKRTEARGPTGRIIADPAVKVDVGKYIDSMGIGHVCISFSDPQLEGGDRRTYIIPRAGAKQLAEGLKKIAGEVSV